MTQRDTFDVFVGISVDSTHELHDLTCFGAIMRARIVEVLANQIKHSLNFAYFTDT